MTAEIILHIRTAQLEGKALRMLRRELRDLACRGRRLILDLSAVEQISAECAALLVDSARRLAESDGALQLTGLRSGVQAFLELLRVHRTVEIRSLTVKVTPLPLAA